MVRSADYREKHNAYQKGYYRRNHAEQLAYHRRRYAEDPERQWAANIRARYNVTAERYYFMLAAQDGRCVCGSLPDDERLHIDHDHSCCPGKHSCGACVRGLLCSPCNRTLGNAYDDEDRLIALAIYIERWNSIERISQ